MFFFFGLFQRSFVDGLFAASCLERERTEHMTEV